MDSSHQMKKQGKEKIIDIGMYSKIEEGRSRGSEKFQRFEVLREKVERQHKRDGPFTHRDGARHNLGEGAGRRNLMLHQEEYNYVKYCSLLTLCYLEIHCLGS